jgi:SAM-dependent methyltransferase
MKTIPGNMYDEVLYNSRPSSLTHPDHLAALTTLFGLSPAPVENCRVLELGCGNGANLIPMALTLPGSRFSGVDMAGVPIAAAQALAAELKLENIAFHQLDLMDLNPGFGEFDYIIAHGVYSWVPPAVRDKLMAICRANLAPRGVAFVSYNTFPGCHLRKMLSGMLAYQTRNITGPELQLKHAYALINFLYASNPKTLALQEELKAIRSRDPSVVFHDDLEPVNDPVYFHEFAEHARAHGLQFLSEAEFFSMQPAGFDVEVVDTIHLLAQGDRIKEQQYLDFLKCRRFRQTLLCHQELALGHEPAAGRIPGLCVSSPAKPMQDVTDQGSDENLEFQTPDGASMTTNLPLAKAAILYLAARWPLAAPFRELPGASEALLADLLLKIYATGLVELHAAPSRFTLEAGVRPRAFSLARLQAESETFVTTLRHTTVGLDDALGRRLVTLLDGTRDRAALLKDLASESSGPLQAEDLERSLTGLARLALLEA